MTSRCPCTSGHPLEACCGRVLADHAAATTAEQLMRSRFSAFALGDTAHLLRTWHPSTRPRDLDLDLDRRWTRLDVERVVDGSPLHTTGVVEFVAHHRSLDGPGRQHETSRFRRESGLWFYLDGVAP